MKRVSSITLLVLIAILGGCTRDPKQVAKKYVDTGNKYFDRGKYKEASLMYRRALQKDLRCEQAYYRLGLTQLKENLYGEARRSFLRASELNPSNTDAVVKLAELDFSIFLIDRVTYKNYLTDVRDITKQLLQRDPKSFDGMRLSGLVALTDGDLKTAEQKFRTANQIKPDNGDVAAMLVQSLFASNQNDEGEKIAKSFIASHADYSPMYDTLYVHYAQANRANEAEQVLKAKVEHNPGNGQDLRQLALHYYLTSHKDEMNATLTRLTSDTKKIPDAHLIAGDFFLGIKDYDHAAQEYRAGEQSDSKNKLLYTKREVEALSLQGKEAEATKVLGDLLKDHPKDAEIVGMHAAKLVATRDPKQAQKAIDELQPLIATTPADQKSTLQMLHFNLARAYLVKPDSPSQEQARLQLQETLRLNSNYLPAKLALAELLLKRGESPRAVQTADDVLRASPNNLAAHLIRTMGLMKMGELDRSRQELNAIVQAAPKSADAKYQLALLDYFEKRFKDAENEFAELQKENDPRGFPGLVNCKVAQMDYDGARSLIQDQLRRNPDRREFQIMFAEIQARSGKLNDAIAEYQRVVQQPNGGGYYVRLGELQRLAGQNEQAIASFQKAKQVAPTDATPLLEIALLYDAANRNEEARRAYEDVLKLQPDNPVALNNIAYSKADEGVDLDQALTFAERARQRMPNDLNISDTIGLIYLRKNLTEESVRVLDELVRRSPNNPTYHLHYAMALYQKGDRTKARQELDKANSFGPSEKEKLRIKELLTKVG